MGPQSFHAKLKVFWPKSWNIKWISQTISIVKYLGAILYEEPCRFFVKVDEKLVSLILIPNNFEIFEVFKELVHHTPKPKGQLDD